MVGKSWAGLQTFLFSFRSPYRCCTYTLFSSSSVCMHNLSRVLQFSVGLQFIAQPSSPDIYLSGHLQLLPSATAEARLVRHAVSVKKRDKFHVVGGWKAWPPAATSGGPLSWNAPDLLKTPWRQVLQQEKVYFPGGALDLKVEFWFRA